MLPDEFVVLREHLPLSEPYAAPQTALEQTLCELWRKVLSMDMVGVHDNYYDLGGDSMLAAAMFQMLKKSTGLTLPLGMLVDAPTVAELAARVEAVATSERTLA